jgi:hypothetical protein
MTPSTTRSGLSRAAALLLAVAFATGWTQSGPVLASSTVQTDRLQTSAPYLADPRVETAGAPTVNAAALAALHEQRENLRPPSVSSPAAVAKPVAKPTVAKPAVAKPRVQAAAPKAPAPKTAVTKASYSGTNRFWIPSLGMSDPVHWFSCTRSRDPDNYIYRWGCAGSNNVYILGHAYGVMKPLHDLYVRGGLRKGMVAIYADGAGRVHWYRVVSWQVVDPTQVTWAIASQSVPSMTLQTCVGKNSQYRLNVRLVQFKVT